MKTITLSKTKIDKIKKVAKKQKVIFGYLFGSQVRGRIGLLSDIDFAFYFDEKLSKKERFERKLKLFNELGNILKRKDIDIVVLNDIDRIPLLGHRIISQGKLLFSSNEKTRILFEVKAMSLYFDFKPYLEKYQAEVFK